LCAYLAAITRFMAFRENRPGTPTVNEARYRLAIDAARLGTWTWDVATDVATFDDRVRELLGLSDENARSRASIIETRVHPDDRERLNAALMLATDPSGDGRFQGEYRIARPDGSERWILAFARMHFAADREPRQAAQLIGTVLDITDQKRAEARQRLLAKLGADLLVASDERTALQQLADAAVTDLADWAIVDVVDVDGTARRAAMAHADPAKLKIMLELADRYPPDPARPTLGREALLTGRARLYAQIDDALLNTIARDSEQARLARAMGMRSAIAVPLQTRTGPFGIAAFGSSRRSFTADDLSVAEEIGRRASLAVDNARLMAEAKRAQDAAERAARRTARLQALSAALASALTPNDAVTAAVREGIAAVGADAGLLVLVDPAGTSLDVMDALGYDPSRIERWRRFPLGANVPIADAVRSGEIIVVESGEERERRYPGIDAGAPVTYPGSISVPLISEGRSFGALGLSFHGSLHVTPEDRELLLAVARQCAQAVRRAVLFDAEGLARASAEEAGRRLKFLADASAALASLDYEATLRRVAQLAVPSFADYVVIDLLNEVGDLQRVAYAHVDSSKTPLLEQSARYYPSASHDGHPFREPLEKGEPVLVAHVDDAWTRRLAPVPEHLSVVQALQPTSAIMAPLSARGHTLGLMTFATSVSARAFSAADVSLAGEVAQRAAVAVDNARLYRQSEIARYEAEAASRAKGQFLAVMSHELRTPLNAILGYSELVEMGVHGPVSDAQREAMGRIRRSGQHLLALVNNVLNLERSETNNLETEVATLTVAQLFDDANTLTRPQAEAKGITLTVHSPLPELSVLGEREKAGQVLVNLLSNAVKFTPSGGRIDLAYDIGDDAVTLRVSDSGPGIPADSLHRIFEPFVQLDSGLTRRAEGAGLGLAISRRLARLMGGDLTVESEVGKGSRFSFTLVRVA
jgi:PAS domain S-box-containing protein